MSTPSYNSHPTTAALTGFWHTTCKEARARWRASVARPLSAPGVRCPFPHEHVTSTRHNYLRRFDFRLGFALFTYLNLRCAKP